MREMAKCSDDDLKDYDPLPVGTIVLPNTETSNLNVSRLPKWCGCAHKWSCDSDAAARTFNNTINTIFFSSSFCGRGGLHLPWNWVEAASECQLKRAFLFFYQIPSSNKYYLHCIEFILLIHWRYGACFECTHFLSYRDIISWCLTPNFSIYLVYLFD